MTKPFSETFKGKMVRRMTGKNATSAMELGREMGIHQQTLSYWMKQARSVPDMAPGKKPTTQRSVEEKARLLTEAAKLTGEQLPALLEREGLMFAELEQWRLALEDGRSSKAATSRIRSLERELARKEKALAEAAALLILKKKLHDAFGDEDDATDEESEK